MELRQQRLLQRQIARQAGVSASTVSGVLARAGLSRLSDLQPREPVQRYEHEAPSDLLHIDIKKLGRIARPGHRVTGNRRDTVDGVGWEYLFVAVDDHARIAFTPMHPDETKRSAVHFLREAVAWYAGLGARVRRLLTDNGSAFRSHEFARACQELGIRHTNLRERIVRRPTVKLNASSSRLYVSGPMHGRTKARLIASKPWRGSITTTGIELIAPSAALRRWRDFLRRETTS